MLSKVKAADVQAVVNWSVEPAQALVAKNMRQVGMEQPLFQSHGFGNISYVQAAGKAAEGIIFPCGRLFYAELLAASHPQKQVLVGYKRAYETKYKEDASTFGGHAYDAFLILSEALKKAGTTDKFKVRDAIEGLKGLAGTGGVFNFSPDGPQRAADRRLRDVHGEERGVRPLHREVGGGAAWSSPRRCSTCSRD